MRAGHDVLDASCVLVTYRPERPIGFKKKTSVFPRLDNSAEGDLIQGLVGFVERIDLRPPFGRRFQGYPAERVKAGRRCPESERRG